MGKAGKLYPFKRVQYYSEMYNKKVGKGKNDKDIFSGDVRIVW